MSTSPPIVPALSQGGTITGNLSITGSITGSNSGSLQQLVATTGATGFALTGATPTILTWTSPNDGNMHRVQVYYQQTVTSAETGGAVGLTATGPGGANVSNATQFNAGGAGTGSAWTTASRLVAPNTTVTVNQSSALTVGAATVYAEMWAS